MVNKVIKRIDEQKRLQLPKNLINRSSIKNEGKVAICSMGKNLLKLRKPENIGNRKVITFVKMDSKGRIIIPSEIREKTESFEIFLFNGDLILKEAPE